MAKDTQDSGTLLSYLMAHGASAPVSFHMPGHKGDRLYRENGYGPFLDAMMNCDVTEIPGADNLFQPVGVLRRAMERYRNLYEVEASYLLINGSSGGLIAAILASVPRGGRLVMARNAHKSIFNALSLGDVTPVYAYPTILEAYGLQGPVTAEEIARCLDHAPDASAVIVPSPNYYGICSDIEAIARVVHERDKILIVDQAHGAHLAFFEKYGIRWADSGQGALAMPRAAERQGADAVINSIHKTLASFTQTAVLNICSSRIDRRLLEDRLQAIESSSPSYLLMASLDINAALLEAHGPALFASWAADIGRFYEQAPQRLPHLRLMRHPLLDPTKLNFDMAALGFSGRALERHLMADGIFPELISGNLVMGMTGIGNRWEDYARLLASLEKLEMSEAAVPAEPCGGEERAGAEAAAGRAGDGRVRQAASAAGPDAGQEGAHRAPVQPAALTRRLRMEALPARRVRTPLAEAAGRVCAVSVIPYPPGVPLICPGEVFDEEVIAYIVACRAAGETVIGLDEDGCVVTGAAPIA